MKLENKIFIETTKTTDIPWELLEGSYERGSNFPQWIASITDEHNDLIVDSKEKIALNFEHQGTLWSVTPFTLLILRKTLKKTNTPLVIASILDLYGIIYEIANDYMRRYKEAPDKPLPLFSDMLKKENLLPPVSISFDNYDDEELLSEEYHDNMTDELFISFFYYSWLILAYSIKYDFPLLKEIPDDLIQKRLEKFENKTVNLFLNDILTND